MGRESIGIDVSKSTLDAYSTTSESWQQFANDRVGIKQLLKWIKQEVVEIICLEATGAYSRLLLRSLEKQGLSFLIVNPKRLRDFARGLGKLAKTDKLDARVIAFYGEKSDDQPSHLISEEEEELKDLCARRQQISLMFVQEQNRLKVAAAHTKSSIRETMRFLNAQLKKLSALIEEKLKQTGSFTERAKLLRSVKGVGPVTCAILLSCLPELGKLNKREVAALCGLAPFNYDSGTFKGQQRIFGGRTVVRTALYMATLSAVQHNPTFKTVYRRLMVAGKKRKVALTACARKMVVILNAMLRNGTSWKERPVSAIA